MGFKELHTFVWDVELHTTWPGGIRTPHVLYGIRTPHELSRIRIPHSLYGIRTPHDLGEIETPHLDGIGNLHDLGGIRTPHDLGGIRQPKPTEFRSADQYAVTANCSVKFVVDASAIMTDPFTVSFHIRNKLGSHRLHNYFTLNSRTRLSLTNWIKGNNRECQEQN